MANGGEDKEGQDRGYFKANGLEHFTFSPKTIISWGVLSGLIGLITASIVVYRSFGSQVDERIDNHRELNRKLDKFTYDIDNLEEETKEMKSEQRSIICQMNKGRNCK